MRPYLIVSLAAAFLALAGTARAEAIALDDRGFEGSVRVGFGLPSGDAYTGGPVMRSIFEPQGELALDLGARVSRNLFLGVYVGAGLGALGLNSNAFGDRRLASTGRVGVQIQYRLAPEADVMPWIGYGIGVTGAWLTDYGTGARYTELLGGIDYAHLMGGIDFNLGAGVGLGLFVDYGVGEYFLRQRTVDGIKEFDGSLKDRAVHQWLRVGPRLAF